MASLRYVLLLQRDVKAAAKYYNQGVGLPVRILTESWAELGDERGVLALKQAPGEAYATPGYTPVLTFDVDDLQSTLTRMLQLGGIMDGAVQHSSAGKVAVVRGPDGHVVGIMEE